MTQQVSALIVHAQSESIAILRPMLRGLGIRIREANTCHDAIRILHGAHPPQLVLTELVLPDGDWKTVVSASRKARLPVASVVVGRVVNTKLYVEIIEFGGFDFIIPPFVPAEIAYVVRCAADSVKAKRASAEGVAAMVARESLMAPRDEASLAAKTAH
jgi:DNA-binding NtrC family response regulator